ncbi:MAG: hypothetical protein AABZ28_05040 [Nitrospinota bacterium]
MILLHSRLSKSLFTSSSAWVLYLKSVKKNASLSVRMIEAVEPLNPVRYLIFSLLKETKPSILLALTFSLTFLILLLIQSP